MNRPLCRLEKAIFLPFLFFFLASCSHMAGITPTDTKSATLSTIEKATPTAFIPLPSPTIPALPADITLQKIDGVLTAAEFHPGMNTWTWKDKKGAVRRLVDPLTGHLLVRTSAADDRLTYDIDLAFKWEVNLVNYQTRSAHAPFGSAYIHLLQAKFPAEFAQAGSDTGITFRILQASAQEIADPSAIITILDSGTEKERFFLKPTHLPATNEYVLSMGMRTDFLTRMGAINTYTDEMLNYCLASTYPPNPSGAWGIEVYKHTIK
jgi:hypothetical protein